MMSRRLILAVATLALATPALAQDLVKVAIGQRGGWDSSMYEIGMMKGIFQKHGLKVETLWTQGSGETVQTVISGAVDVGGASGTTGVMAAFARGAPVRPIGNSMTGADDLFWYVKKDSPLKSMKEAAGKTIAYSTNGSSTHLAVLGFQRHFGIKMKLTAAGSPPAVLTQVLSNQIDIGWSSPPLVVEQLREGIVRILARESEVPEFRDQTVRMTIANLNFINSRPDVLDRLRKAYQEVVDWMYEGDEVFDVFQKFVGTAPDISREVRASFFPKKNLDMTRLSGLEHAMRDAIELKFLAQPLTKDQMEEFTRYYVK